MEVNFTLPLAPSKNHSHRIRVNKKTGTHSYGPTLATEVWASGAGIIALDAALRCGWKCTHGEDVIVLVSVYFPDKRKRDAHNQEMVLFDALQGVIYDDDYYIKSHNTIRLYDKDNPRLEVTVMKWSGR